MKPRRAAAKKPAAPVSDEDAVAEFLRELDHPLKAAAFQRVLRQWISQV